MDLSFLPPLREVIKIHELNAKKSLGQNFILDLNVTRKIAKSAPNLDKGTIIEIGPGPGGLTRALLECGAQNIIAIEQDPRAIQALHDLKTASQGHLRVIEGDALAVDIHTLGEAPRQIVANLPYNIATPLLFGWLKHAHNFCAMTLMFQKEVAKRLVAKPKTKDYGRLAVIVQWLTDPKILFDLPPSVFVPAPKVTSSVVQLVPLKKPRFPCDREALEEITKLGFGQRRKMLRSSLKAAFEDVEKVLLDLNINPQCRAEELTLEEFCRIASYYKKSPVYRGF
ncbi:16S rRNA (adenine(1518)-N(6)/adenine(1519)-N(6))-dimethyltransferase RsmA [Candidatus Nucleicultrix amoebiphila]|jgi:16S rRNA (adenine1518-N6/adenine1519-N6)-dimethyltransferase|uniref:16S rRNA (adenine(1518)-N(6)/adenine(1519)-N(6))- dimethyltransferase RsmA n=1 Tax=Candidatus Nucleicultrix amoebiphila TaxID=1509244 RepID=UPI000A2704B0|nr:16S rRNA (adenine(1518)-N(6)/adenine(1519)-N(6))-dimethyltransferase RsmA [Candidatus Nucleicultrix amoebiphila]